MIYYQVEDDQFIRLKTATLLTRLVLIVFLVCQNTSSLQLTAHTRTLIDKLVNIDPGWDQFVYTKILRKFICLHKAVEKPMCGQNKGMLV